MSATPHSSWAEVYDFAYQRSYGDFYERLTEATVDLVVDRIACPARIVDFGAGTGRLAIPLSQRGYAVTAVEPCGEMLAQLRTKDPLGRVIPVCSSMADFHSEEGFDAALCVFTVILYLLDEEALRRSLGAAHACLKTGGVLLVDVPSEAIFTGYTRRDTDFERLVSVSRADEGIYLYREELLVKGDDGESSRYVDEFRIRHWHLPHVLRVLEEIGFHLSEDLSAKFAGSGSSYLLLRKEGLAPWQADDCPGFAQNMTD